MTVLGYERQFARQARHRLTSLVILNQMLLSVESIEFARGG